MEMKRAGAAAICRKTRHMTLRQKVEFWRRETDALLKEQQAARHYQSKRPMKKSKSIGGD